MPTVNLGPWCATRSGLYGEGLLPGTAREPWLEVIVPDAAGRTIAHDVIYDELVQGRFVDESRDRYLEIIDQLITAGAQGVIAGCTEIELVVTADDVTIPYFPTTMLHAVAAVDAALAG